MANPSVDHIFTYHPPFGDQPQRYEALRAQGLNLARDIERHCPPSRERSLAITHLQQTIMFANAAIAINEQQSDAAQIALWRNPQTDEITERVGF